MFDPQPRFAQRRTPKQVPKRTVPSYLYDEDLVSNWLIYNGRGDVLIDYGVGNDGDFYGPSWVDGPFGWALEFNSAEEDYIDLDGPTSLNLTESLSIELWYKATSALGTNTRVWMTDAEGYEVWAPAENSMRFRLTNTADTSIEIAQTFSVDVWYHFVGTYDGSTAEVYVNGTSIGTDTLASPLKDTTQIYIGTYDTTIQFYDGLIGVLRVYDKALPESRVVRHYERTKAIYGKS